MKTPNRAKYGIGQVVQHLHHAYRGVVVDIDAAFTGTDEDYEAAGRHRPNRVQPWYHLLVDDAQHTAYAAESSLVADTGDEPVYNPDVDAYFAAFQDGQYHPRSLPN